MATELHAKVTEVTSGSRFEDKIRRAKIEVETKSSLYHNTLVIPDKENEYHLDRDLVLTIETYSENYDRTKARENDIVPIDIDTELDKSL